MHFCLPVSGEITQRLSRRDVRETERVAYQSENGLFFLGIIVADKRLEKRAFIDETRGLPSPLDDLASPIY